MIRFVLLACALVLALPSAIAGKITALTESAPYIEVARWMAEQRDVEMRAVGLAALTEMGQPGPAIEPSRYLSEARALLDDGPTATAVFLLAQGCDNLEVLDACEEAGVLDAVHRLDGGNPAAAGLFHDPGSPGYRSMLIDARYVDDHVPDIVATWFEALQSDAASGVKKGSELLHAFSISLATALPGLGALTEQCRAAIETDEALDGACQRLSEQMRTSGRSLLMRNMGYGMAVSRAEQIGDQLLADRLRGEGNEIRRLGGCLSESATEALSTQPETQRRYLSHLREGGEVAATGWILESFGSRCGDGGDSES